MNPLPPRVVPTGTAPPRLPRRKRPASAWTCTALNQLAFPGLGTILAGRRIGYVQAAVMLLGFVLVMAFMAGWFAALFRLATESGWSEQSYHAQVCAWGWAGLAGLGLCALAWVWSLFSSIAILRQARHTPPPMPAQRP